MTTHHQVPSTTDADSLRLGPSLPYDARESQVRFERAHAHRAPVNATGGRYSFEPGGCFYCRRPDHLTEDCPDTAQVERFERAALAFARAAREYQQRPLAREEG